MSSFSAARASQQRNIPGLRTMIVAVLLVLGSSSLAEASPFELIAGYEPATQVTDPVSVTQ
jgi:hypothetical protein